MATVYVGSARIDENGKAYGGKAGDQKSGREVGTQKYYVHSKGWRVFRPTDPKKAEIIGDQMKAACANNKIGYDQHERYDLFREAKKVGFDLAKVNVATECDCSELVRCCCAAAGIMDLPTSGFRTGNMPTNLLKTGEFVELVGDKYTKQSTYLGKGDILVTKVSGHTVVVLNNGDKYEGTVSGKVEEKTYKLGDRLLKRTSPLMSGDDIKDLQTRLNALGHKCGEPDGKFGKNTETGVKAFQTASKIEVDGMFGSDSFKALKAAEAAKQPSNKEHTVVMGDSLWKIAEKHLGKGSRYPEIMKLNNLTSTVLRRGQKLKIPNE